MGTSLVLMALSPASAVAAPAAAAAADCPASPGAATPAQVREQAQRLQALRQMLNDADANVRLSALGALLSGCDAAGRELAFEAGFASADETMRALALRARIRQMRNLVVDLGYDNKPLDKAEEALLQRYKRQLVLALSGFDEQAHSFEVNGRYGQGSLSGLSLSITYRGGLVLSLRLGEGSVLLGSLAQGGLRLPARVLLR